MTSLPIRRLFLFVTIGLAAAASLLASENQRGGRGGGQQTAASSSGPQTVDFVAVAADGQPVTDLIADQVSLKIDGKDRALVSLELVRFDTTGNLLPVPFATNAAADAGRDFVLVIDEESLFAGTENPLREALLTFGAALPARERIGVFTVPRGTTSLAPTADRAKFRAAVAAIQGRARADLSANDQRCHARDVLTGLASIVTATGNPDSPTPVALVSAGLVGPTTGSANAGSSSGCLLQANEFQRMGRVAEAARAQFFVVRPEEVREAGLAEGLENVVGVTGGQMMALGRATDDAMVRITRETSAYYVATFTAEADERNGASHRLELRSSRPDVTIRSRTGVQIARPEGSGAITPQSMLRTAAVQRGFGLRAMAVSSRNDGDAKNPIKLVGLAEPVDPSITITAAAVGVYDPTGKLVAQWTAKPEELKRSPLMAALVVPDGTYRFRVAAMDSQGRAATADYAINTAMTSAGVAQLGGLLIGTGGTSFAPKLQFSNDPEVIVYFELYGRPTGPFGALVEIAETLDGPAVASAQPTPAATPVQDKFIFTATLPVASLRPGDYVVRASIGFEGHQTGVLARTIRKR